MKNKQYPISFLFVIILLLNACGKRIEQTSMPQSDDVIAVKVISITKSDVHTSIHSSGQFTTDDETQLSFKTSGVIRKIFVKEGDKIKKGQVIASLDLTEIAAQVNQYQLAFDKASRDYQRAENLYRDSVVTLEQFQNAKTGLEIVREQLAGAKFNLSHSEIRATQDGIILKKISNEGQIVGAGIPVLLTSSKGQSDWILRVAISDKEWAQTKLNDKAKVDIDALNLHDQDGFISSKTENADPLTGSFSIDIKLNSARKLNIASGMFGKVEILTSRKSKMWHIPYDALLDGNANYGFVFLTNDNKIASKVAVKIESIEKDSVLISEGLSDYQSLIVSGNAYLNDKSSIKVLPN